MAKSTLVDAAPNDALTETFMPLIEAEHEPVFPEGAPGVQPVQLPTVPAPLAVATN